MAGPAPQQIPAPTAAPALPDVAYAALVRVGDQAILAQKGDKAPPADVKKYEVAVSQLVERAATLPAYPGWKDSLEVAGDLESGSVCTMFAVADAQALAIVAVTFQGPVPERVARDFLQELASSVRLVVNEERVSEARLGKLNVEFKKALKDTVKSQNDPSKMDRVLEAQAKVEQVKGLMQENVKKILETHVTLENLQDKSQNMSQSADLFLKRSTAAKRQLQWSNIRVKVMVAASVATVLLIVTLPIFHAVAN